MIAGLRSLTHITPQPGVSMGSSELFGISGFFRRARTLQGDIVFIYLVLSCMESLLNDSTVNEFKNRTKKIDKLTKGTKGFFNFLSLLSVFHVESHIEKSLKKED